jgi:uncharacterized protein YggE
MAADLAKLSLWLATLAKDHPFTFLDHSLRAGDSLVGLGRKQIASLHWDAKAQRTTVTKALEDAIRRAAAARRMASSKAATFYLPNSRPRNSPSPTMRFPSHGSSATASSPHSSLGPSQKNAKRSLTASPNPLRIF